MNTTAPTKTGTIILHARCPHCASDLTAITLATLATVAAHDEQGHYDNRHNQGRGGYPLACDSCGEAFVIEAPAVHDIQHLALVLLGEA